MESTPEVVQDFKTELNSLFQARLPISRAKMTAVTKKAMKAIKYYKHVVMIVEKFVSKGAAAYKVPALYVIDSIVRQSKHQYSGSKEVYGPRFSKNFEKTFSNLFQCSEDDQSKIMRVLNLWSTNNIYSQDVITSLLNLAPPSTVQSQAPPTNSPQEQPSSTQSAPDDSKDQAAMLVENQEQIDSLLHQQQKQLQSLIEAGAGQPMISLLLNKAQQLQELQAIQQRLISESQVQKPHSQPHTPVQPHPLDILMNDSGQQHSSEFNKALLDDFDYSSDEEEGGHLQPPPPDPPPVMLDESENEPLLPVALPIPEALSATAFIEELNKQFIKSRDRESEAPPLPAPDRLESSPSPLPPSLSSVIDQPSPPHGPPPPSNWMPGPPPPPLPPNFHRPSPPAPSPGWQQDRWSPRFPRGPNNFFPPPRPPYPGPPPPPPPPPSSHGRFSPPHPSFRPRSPPHHPFHHRDRDGVFRERSPFRHERGMSPPPPPFRGRRDHSPFRGHSPPYRNWSPPPYRGGGGGGGGGDRRSNFDDTRLDWGERREREERDRESRKVNPPPRSDHVTVCSNTVWIGHLGKNADKEQILEAVKEFGPVKSIDHVLARGCAYIVMENRRDAVRAVDRLHVKGQKCKVAWAPGRGLKDKAYKEFWDVDRGISYIPLGVVRSTGSSVEALSDGGWVDPDTIPPDIENNTVNMTIED